MEQKHVEVISRGFAKANLIIRAYSGPALERLESLLAFGEPLAEAERMVELEFPEFIYNVETHNLVVDAGLNLIRDLLGITSGVTGLNRYAVGTDNTAVAAGDTTLGTEVFRGAFTDKILTAKTLTLKLYISSTEANGNTLVEAGLFGDDATDSADTGTLYARATHTGIAKTTSIGVTYSHVLSWADDGA